MPRGIPNTKPTTVIDIPARSGVRGRLDRLLSEYTMKAHALKIATEILDEDDRRVALELAPKKFLHALNHRASSNGDGLAEDDGEASLPKKTKTKRARTVRKAAAERLEELRDFLMRHPGASTKEIASGLGLKGNTVRKFTSQIAKPQFKVKRKQMIHWVLRGGSKVETGVSG